MSSTTTEPPVDDRAARPITLPLGVATDGTPLSWRLTDTHGHPLHGLVVGPRGSGGSTALARLAHSAHAAGVRTGIVALDHGSDYPDPAWQRAPRGTSWCVDADDLLRETDALLAETGPAPGPLLILVDGASALRAMPEQWLRIIRQAARLQVSIVARVHAPTLAEFGSDALRCHLAAEGQFLALGRLLGTTAAVGRDVLPGYTTPLTRQKPGRGVYGHDGRAVPVDVDAAGGQCLRAVPAGEPAPTPIGYEVGAGRFPYRIDGRRLSQSEAVSVLEDIDGASGAEALRRLNLAATAAIRDAAPPRVTCGFDGRYRIGDGPAQPRQMSHQDLVHDWRMTPAEAEAALEGAETARLSA